MATKAVPVIDLSEFEAEARHAGGICWYGRLDLDPEQKAMLDEALATPRIKTSQIARKVTKWGTPVGGGSVGRHRHKECSCGH